MRILPLTNTPDDGDPATPPQQGGSAGGPPTDGSSFAFPVPAEADLGPTIEQVRALVETYANPVVLDVTDPLTGANAPALLTRTGITPVPASCFDDYLTAPRFRRGTARLRTVESLIAHINRFKGKTSAIFANDDRESLAPSLTAVLDYHEEGSPEVGAPSFGRHRSVFNFPLSDQWKAWTEADGKKMSMAEFAAFLEDHSIDVLESVPDLNTLSEDLRRTVMLSGGASSVATALKLIELSRGLKINENAVVREAINLSSGEGEVLFQAEHQDEAGQRLRVPTMFLLAIPIFKDGPLYRVAARLRYRARGGVTFWFDLWRMDRAFDHAFDEVCTEVQTKTALPLFFGTPE